MTENEKYADYIKVPNSTWTRPKCPKKVWRIVQGRKKMNDGEIPRFIIQEIPEELEEFIIDSMLPQYLAAEPICSSLDMHNDQQALREFRTLWKNIFGQGISIAVLKVNSDSTAEPVIAGFNILHVLTAEDINCRIARREDTSLGVRNSSLKKLVSVLGHMRHNADILGEFGVDKYLAAVGLFIHPTFRGQGLGEELLRARGDVGCAYRIPATATIFIAPSSIISATRAGFEILVEKKIRDIVDAEGNVAYPLTEIQEMKLMGKRFYWNVQNPSKFNFYIQWYFENVTTMNYSMICSILLFISLDCNLSNESDWIHCAQPPLSYCYIVSKNAYFDVIFDYGLFEGQHSYVSKN